MRAPALHRSLPAGLRRHGPAWDGEGPGAVEVTVEGQRGGADRIGLPILPAHSRSNPLRAQSSPAPNQRTPMENAFTICSARSTRSRTNCAHAGTRRKRDSSISSKASASIRQLRGDPRALEAQHSLLDGHRQPQNLLTGPSSTASSCRLPAARYVRFRGSQAASSHLPHRQGAGREPITSCSIAAICAI